MALWVSQVRSLSAPPSNFKAGFDIETGFFLLSQQLLYASFPALSF
jgi:hypothetical protein